MFVGSGSDAEISPRLTIDRSFLWHTAGQSPLLIGDRASILQDGRLYLHPVDKSTTNIPCR